MDLRAPLSSPPVSLLDRSRRALQSLLHFAYPVGFCRACQRTTEWRDVGVAYVCRACGGDPVDGHPFHDA